jgi:hypothetical protein
VTAVATHQAPSTPSSDRFAPASECLRRHPGLSRVRLYYLGMLGSVRVELPPGRTPRYSVADLDRVLADQGE